MHLINNHIGGRLQRRSGITLPTVRIGGLPVNNGGPLPVYSDSTGVYSGSISLPLVIDLHIESIELANEVLTYHNCPGSFFPRLHLYRFISMSALACLIKHQTYFICRRRPKSKLRCLRCILHFNQTSCTDRI